MENKATLPWRFIIQNGLISGAVSLMLALVGMALTFNSIYIIYGVVTLGEITLYLPIIAIGYLAAQKMTGSPNKFAPIITAALTGVVGGSILTLFVLIGQVVNLRNMFINASPELYEMIAAGIPLPLGALAPILIAAVTSAIASCLLFFSDRIKTAALQSLLVVLLTGIMRDLIMTVMQRWGIIGELFRWMFAESGLTIIGAIVLFLITFALVYRNAGKKKPSYISKLQPKQQKVAKGGLLALAAILVLLLPQILGIFFSDILDTVGIFILMGLGLNIVVGFAGLLDLGYVAFFAIGAYTVGILTSPEMTSNPWTWWAALPIALFMAVLAGVILGLPVLRLRGDYLAIVTLGFGEIIRLLALSDWLKPYLGGTQGIQQIAQPIIGPVIFDTQQELYYLILLFIGIAAFVAWRLKASRVGRSWMALREDEDVAMAMGMNNVTTKLMAFGMGALFSGLAGTLFAAKLTSVYPSSFNLLVSINVLALIIVGGMGSIPGVFVGALVLMGLPELLREFAEFRYMVYGAVLVVMMLYRPEGLWPEARRKLELHEDLAEEPEVIPTAGQ